MNAQQKIKLNFHMGQRELELVQGVLDKILNIKRMAVSLAGMMIMTGLLAAAWGNGEATAPLLLFSGLISILFLVLLIYAVYTKPQLIKGMRLLAQKEGTIEFREDDISIMAKGAGALTVGYHAIRGQYWLEDHYILYFDNEMFKNLLCVHINKENFDDIFMLANILQGRKKRLIRLKMKRRGR